MVLELMKMLESMKVSDDVARAILEEMTKEERSLLLYFEARLVDRAGTVDHRNLNATDMMIAKQWGAARFIEFGRLRLESCKNDATHWVRFTDAAWILAQCERRRRAERVLVKAPYKRTCDEVEY